MFCENCGSQLPDGSKFCMNCGAKASAVEKAAVTAVEESAAATDAVEVDSMPDAVSDPAPADTETAKVQTVQPQAAQPEPVKSAPQPIQAKPAPQPAQATPVSQPAPQPRPVQPTPQTQTYRQPTTPIQQPEAVQKPEKVNPLSVWKFIGILLLQAIPVIGLIMILVWSFGSSFNKNTKNYARAVLILGLIQFALMVAFLIVNWAFISYVWNSFGSMFEFGGGGSFGGIRG